MKLRKLFLLSFSLTIVLVFLAPQTFAQTTSGINLTLTPTFLSLHTDPGKEITGKFTVKNNNNVSEDLELSLVKFKSSNTDRGIALSDVPSDDPFKEWIKFSDNSFTLASNQQKTVTVTISTPKDAALGYYYGVLVSRKKNVEKGGGAVIAGAPAIPILLDVRSDNAKREMQLVSLTTDNFINEYLPVNFHVKVKNTGNIHGVVSGSIFIDSLSKKEIGFINVNEGRGNILPSSERTFDASWSDGFAVRVPKQENGHSVTDSKGNPTYRTNFDFSKADKFRMGRYTAHALLIYDNGERDIPLEATVTFWVIPWKILTVAAIVVLLVVIGLLTAVISNVRRIKRAVQK